MATARTPRERWITAGLNALRDGGVEAVRVELLAKALGVTKGGFYGYFADRQALLDEMLDAWEQDVTTGVIERVEAGGGDARTKLLRVFEVAREGEALLTDIVTDFSVRDWARRDPAVAARLRRVDNRRMNYLRDLFRPLCADDGEVEVRANICLALWVANRFVDVDHPGRSRDDVRALVQHWLVR